jgi:glutaminyl-tRNA synthetase
MRDPAIYRIKNAEHHRTGDKWHIYPMYSYAHPIEDALENITHSLCTLEFEDPAAVLRLGAGEDRVVRAAAAAAPAADRVLAPEPHLHGDEQAIPQAARRREARRTAGTTRACRRSVGVRRRGYTPEGLRLLVERVGVSKCDSFIDYSLIEDCQREVLNEIAPRRIAVLDPLKLVIDNWPKGHVDECFAPNHPQKPTGASARCRCRTSSGSSARTSWRCRRRATSGYSRQQVRSSTASSCAARVLEGRADGKVDEVLCDYLPRLQVGLARRGHAVRYKGVIHWLSAAHALRTCVVPPLRPACFREPHPGDGDVAPYLDDINRTRKFVVMAISSLPRGGEAEERFQFDGMGISSDKSKAPPLVSRARVAGCRNSTTGVFACAHSRRSLALRLAFGVLRGARPSGLALLSSCRRAAPDRITRS